MIRIREDLRHDNLARKLAEENTRHAVLAAYTGALKGSEDSRRSAFNAALRAYRMIHPDISEGGQGGVGEVANSDRAMSAPGSSPRTMGRG